MKESEKLRLLASVVQMLSEAGSWTGRMHIHKLLYLAQELMGLDSEYEFVSISAGPIPSISTPIFGLFAQSVPSILLRSPPTGRATV